MTKRVCAEDGCPALGHWTRCPTHTRQRDRARGSASARGYGSAHRQLRATYQRRMDAGERFTCWRPACGKPIDPNHWTLGHCDLDRSRYHGPECPACDYATSGRTGCPHPSHAAAADPRTPLG